MVPLSAAMATWRDELTRAWWDGRARTVWFKPSPAELKLQVAATSADKGNAGSGASNSEVAQDDQGRR